MADSYIQLSGHVIPATELKLRKARELATVLLANKLPWVELVECRKIEDDSSSEVVVIDVDVEIGQRPKNDIHRFERVAVEFAKDNSVPEVLALRDDFPLVAHLNMRQQDFPRSLCLFDQKIEDLNLRWNSTWFITTLCEWFRKTARDELHAEDQALEPLLMPSYLKLVVPYDLGSSPEEEECAPLVAECIPEDTSWVVAVAQRAGDRKPTHVATTIGAAPQVHGVIHRQPMNLAELHQFLTSAGTDLISILRARLLSWQDKPEILSCKLILAVILPKTRTVGGDVENTEIRAFLTPLTVKEVGESIGIWQLSEASVGRLLPTDESKTGDSLALLPVNIVPTLSREKAAELSGLPNCDSPRIVAIGQGAIGSQVSSNLIRMGWGDWCLVDCDHLLPHNLVRHELPGFCMGTRKSESISALMNSIIEGNPVSSAVFADVLNPREDAQTELSNALASADVILDMSTSVAVARHICLDVPSEARRVSLFLSPSGKDAVLLAEDASRSIPLDCLEMQYYRALIRNEKYVEHLVSSEGMTRYAGSCRDLSSRIPQDLISVHAGFGARGLRSALSGENAIIMLWRTDNNGLSAECDLIEPVAVRTHSIDGWTICLDEELLAAVSTLRNAKLPKETGGVIVGSVDMQRQRLYLVDALPAPPDSEEAPSYFIRGTDGLVSELDDVGRLTAGWLQYLGEWHSHPVGCGCSRSSDDCSLCRGLAVELKLEGLPGLMMIVGDASYAVYLEQ